MRTVPLAAAAALLFLAVPAHAQEKRVDFYDPSSRRVGHAVIESQSGRVDFYDARSRRTGYGKTEDGRWERFDLRSRRAGGRGPEPRHDP
ncbi:MAG: hypothetical protein A3J27_15440 [Candidatus Tectomicrobia bacterium RIFCSPLOWO2_12_FULL_69_37]|nr:MAG: hypothetical protein A3I72_11415 [Candidatus Tectomicrobia bacterium RIFCSPLOWO2_02_FULL_70_19]OGL63798.1 MAG: hypothetical protein A3J27_15440 [Candidatus Tectomicrobia bacterium RIFCSPLOWO2_12_FULL_69_37]